MPHVKVPSLILHADGRHRDPPLAGARDPRRLRVADDVEYHELKGAPHYLEGHRREAMEIMRVLAAGALSVSAPGKNEKLSLGTKLIYGAPSIAGAAMAIPVAIHVNPFYSDTVLVPLAWVALAGALARVLDAIVDPFVGWLSDHTHTRWGRRRPWIAVAAPIAALVFVALFTPPTWLSTSGAAVWFGTCLMLFFMLNMLYGLPHAALGPELTLDYHERSTPVLGARGLRPGRHPRRGDRARRCSSRRWATSAARSRCMALAYAALMVVLYWLLVLRVRERPDFVERKSNPLVPGVRRSLRNRPFSVLFLCYVVASIPGAIPGLLMPYFNRYVLNPPPIDAGVAQSWLSIFLARVLPVGARVSAALARCWPSASAS